MCKRRYKQCKTLSKINTEYSINFSSQFSHRGPHPNHIPRFSGIRCQLLKAGVLKQASRLQTLLLQGLVILVGERHGLVLGAHALWPEPVGVDACRNPPGCIHTGARQKYGVVGRVCTAPPINSSKLISTALLSGSYSTAIRSGSVFRNKNAFN